MHITQLWKAYGGGAKYFCLSTKTQKGKWEDHFFHKDELSKVCGFIKEHMGRNIYFCPHGFSKPRRVKDYAVLPKLLWSDMDEADPRTCKIKPTIAFESSPGRYVGLWLLDSQMNESMNRRLAYCIGADKSGWDLTQVLRLPGTVNYKYSSLPKVRTIISDGDSWEVSKIEAMLPRERKDPNTASVSSDVFKRVAKQLPYWLKKELTTRVVPKEGKRSEMVWKLMNSLVEAGVDKEDALTLVKSSVWNKFKGRRNEDEQLEREWDKSINHHFDGKAAQIRHEEVEENEGVKIVAKSMADVTPRDTRWVWYPYLARGEIAILEGDPQAGKSYLAMMVAASLATKKGLPKDGLSPKVEYGPVVYFDLENSPESVTVKRLMWNSFGKPKDYHQVEQCFSVEDTGAMEQVYNLVGRIRPSLVVFDTLNSYIGKADTSQGSASQQNFMKFVSLARTFDCAVLVLRHLTKGGRDKAIYRGQGNIAFVGVARTVMLAGADPENPGVRVMAQTKNNLGRLSRGLSYEIVGKGTPTDIDRSELHFLDYSDVDATMIASGEVKSESASSEGDDFLREALENGPVELSKLETMAEKRSISRRTLFRIADRVGVIKHKGVKGRATWELQEPA